LILAEERVSTSRPTIRRLYGGGYKIKPEQRDRIPAVTHGDGTGRLHTSRETSSALLETNPQIGEITGVSRSLNTSFNENEPM